nr:serine hydrolase [bacterium]
MGPRKVLFFWVIGCIAAQALFARDLGAQPATSREKIKAAAAVVDRLLRDFAATRHMPGLAYGVILDGELVLSGGCGYANLDAGI